jgi:hypothetical protein
MRIAVDENRRCAAAQVDIAQVDIAQVDVGEPIAAMERSQASATR